MATPSLCLGRLRGGRSPSSTPASTRAARTGSSSSRAAASLSGSRPTTRIASRARWTSPSGSPVRTR
eukprot:13322910-Alexandrium_andersonii.AAC.1